MLRFLVLFSLGRRDGLTAAWPCRLEFEEARHEPPQIADASEKQESCHYHF